MRFINKKMVVIVIIIGIISSILIWKNMSDKETKLESVSLNESKTLNNEMFAIMLEQADGTYKEDTAKTWPTDMQYNSNMSGCIDINGNKIENALTFDKTNNIATVDTTSTSYCYLYFSYPKLCETGTKIGECLLENSETMNKDMEGGLYRYQGTKEEITDNYICFGTSSKTECLNSTDKYLYRIIGVDNSGNVKLIKTTSIGTNKWHNNYTDNTTWPQSDLFHALNGDSGDNLDSPITPIFIDSSTYPYLTTDGDWYNKIAWIEWNYGDTTSGGNYNGDTIYAIEAGWEDTVNAKIGLMYIHDYYYAYGVGGNPGTYTEAKTAWIFLGSHEWTMSRYGAYTDSKYRAWGVLSGGQVNWRYDLTNTPAVRPVFYLTSDVEVIGGTGNSTDPLVIN